MIDRLWHAPSIEKTSFKHPMCALLIKGLSLSNSSWSFFIGVCFNYDELVVFTDVSWTVFWGNSVFFFFKYQKFFKWPWIWIRLFGVSDIIEYEWILNCIGLWWSFVKTNSNYFLICVSSCKGTNVWKAALAMHLVLFLGAVLITAIFKSNFLSKSLFLMISGQFYRPERSFSSHCYSNKMKNI